MFMTKTLKLMGVLLAGLVPVTYAQEDKPVIQKGLLLPAPQIVRSPRTAQLLKGATRKVFEEDFEGGAPSWSKSGCWAVGTPTSGPYSGHNSSKCAATNLSGDYPDNANDSLISPLVPLPALTRPSSRLILKFWEWFRMESDYDFGEVKILTDGGSSSAAIDSRSGQSDWRETILDLSRYAGQAIKLGFHFTSDYSIRYSGWYVDDVQIILEEPQPLGATLVSLNHQNFPFIYINVAVDTFGVGFAHLAQSNFQVYENAVLQTNYFEVTPPEVGGGVRLTDIVFLMDNSGTMKEEQGAVRNNVIDFVDNLAASGIDFALGLCRFGASQNSGRPIVEDNGILTSDAEYFKNDVWSRNVIDGGYEPGWDALYRSATAFSFRPGAQKVFILITDESPNYVTSGASSNHGTYSQSQTIAILRSNSITVFAVIPQVSLVIQDYGTIAEATNGKHFDIYSPFDRILDYISSQVANTYVVTYKSSNPVLDGTLRNVEVRVSYTGNVATCHGSYIPGSAPAILRTQATLDLHKRAWAEGTTFTIEAEVVDNVAPYVQSASLYYRKTGAPSYSVGNLTPYSGKTYRGTIPGSVVRTPGLDYYITATDGQSTSSDPSVDPANNPYQIAILPNVAPAITHTPVTSLTPGTPITITAEIVDNTNYVASAKLYYRKTAQLTYQHSEMNHIGGNNYQGIIPSPYVSNDGVEYYIRAADDLGVSSYYGTPDMPIAIVNPLGYVTDKKQMINYFLGENFYVEAERNAQNFANRIEQRINAGTATNKDIEALRRLSLVEGAARCAHPGAKAIAELSSKATIKASVAFILAAAMGELEQVLRPISNNVMVKPFYRGVKNAADKFGKLFGETLGRILGQLTQKLVPHLMEADPTLTENAAREIARQIVGKLEIPIVNKLSKIGLGELVNLTPLEDCISTLYLDIYEKGLPGVPWIGNTEDVINSSLADATSHNFQEGRINSVTQEIVNVRNPEIMTGNVDVRDAIRSKIDLASYVKWGTLVVSLLVTVAAVAAGIQSGVATIPSFLAVLGLMKLVMPMFSVLEVGSYVWGAGKGLYRLHYTLPRQLEGVRKTAFDKGTSKANSPTLKKISDETERLVSLASIPRHWADSLLVVSREVAQEMTSIKSLIQQDRWDEAETKFELLSPKLEQLSSKQNIVNSILDISYLYNDSAPIPGLDSVYSFTGAYSVASDIGLGLSQFALGLALSVKPTGAQRDTVLQIIDDSISRLQALGPAYRQTFYRFNSWGFQVPPIVSIVDYELEEQKAGYSVQCRIKNISDIAVHDVATSLRGASGIDVRAVTETDTLFSILSPREEKTVRWRVTYSGADKVLVLHLDVHPLVIPGDFQGDRKTIFEVMTETSPPTRGTLDNKNIYAYPNPFNPDLEEVTFRFKLAKDGKVTIKIYDSSNTLVARVVSDVTMEANRELAVKWDGRNDQNHIVANGVYFYRITTTAGEEATGKVVVLR